MDNGEIRSLMKISTQLKTLKNGSNINGKEKLQMLKNLKDLKSKPISSNKRAKNNASSKNSENNLTNLKTIEEETKVNISSSIPQEFFDETPFTKSPLPSTPSLKNIVLIKKEDVPIGFFDDPVDDLASRGITIKQQILEAEKQAQSELSSFLTDIVAINEQVAVENMEDGEDINQKEEEELEEQMIQLVYQNKLACLYKQSEQVMLAKGDGSSEIASQLDKVEEEAKFDCIAMTEQLPVTDRKQEDVSDFFFEQLISQQLNKKRKISDFNIKILNNNKTAHLKENENDDDREEDTEDSSADESQVVGYCPLDFM
jgi:hypothetical protein